MRKIPANLLTLYADLLQRAEAGGPRPGSISSKTVRGRKFLYAVEREGHVRTQRYLGPANNASAQAAAEDARRAQSDAVERRATVRALKNASIPAPPAQTGRILHAVESAGLFRSGLVLIGTAAYRLYPAALGYYLSSSAIMTQDADFSVAAFAGGEVVDFEAILQKADPSFKARMANTDKAPHAFKSADGFMVELLTKHVRNRTTPVPVPALTASAEALSFQEYLTEDTMTIVALHGAGVPVRVPAPLRYGIHKLIVAQQRAKTNPKRRKDLIQAKELLAVMREIDPEGYADEMTAARKRGQKWRKMIDASLQEIAGSAPA